MSTDTTTQQQIQATTLAALRQPQASAAPVTLGFFDLNGFELTQRVAKAFSTSSLVPKAYENNLPNCMIALDMAQRMNANPLMVMQNLYIVHGTPGWSAKFLIATINVCGRFSALRYEWRGKPGAQDYGCRAWAVERATGERLDGIWVDWKMVKAEGWDSKNGSKWKTMPDQMFIYRAAAFWQRAYAPELGMGLQTAEELQDTFDATPGPDGSLRVDVDSLRDEPSKPRAGKRVSADVSDVEPRPAANNAAPKTQATTDAPSEDANEQADDFTARAEKIRARLEVAEDVELLDLAADFIGDIDDEGVRDELAALYRKRRAQLEGSSGAEQADQQQPIPVTTTRAGRTRAAME